MGEIADEAENAASGIENATEQAKKLKRTILGFDELNILNDKDESQDTDAADQGLDPSEISGALSGALDDILSQYQAAWDEAFANMENDALTVADNIQKAFEPIFDVFAAAWEEKGEGVMLSLETTLRTIKDVLDAIGNSFMEAFTGGEGQEVIESILGMFQSILELITSIGEAFIIAWNSEGKGLSLVQEIFELFKNVYDTIAMIADSFRMAFYSDEGVALIKSILDLFDSILNLINSIADAFQNAWNSGAGLDTVSAIFNMFSNINEMLKTIADSFAEVFNNGTGEEIITNILNIVENLANIVGNLANQFTEAWNEAELGTEIVQDIFDIINGILETLNKITSKTAEWASQLDFTPLLESIDELLSAIEPLTKNIGEGLEWFWTNVLLPMAGWTIEDAIPAFLDLLAEAVETLNKVLEVLKPLGKWFWEEFLQPLGKWVGDTIIDTINGISDALGKFGDWISQHQEGVQAFVTIIGSLGTGFLAVNKVLPLLSTGLKAASTALSLLTSPAGIAVTAITSIAIAIADLWESSETFRTEVTSAFDDIKESLSKAFDKVKESVSPLIDAFKDLGKSLVDFYENSPLKAIVAFWGSLAAKLGGTVIAKAIDIISDSFKNMATVLRGAIKWLTGVLDVLTGLFTFDFDKIKSGFSKVIDGFKDMGTGMLGNALDLGKNIITGLLDGMSGALSTIGDWLQEHVFEPIIGGFKKLFGIHSPSTVMAEQGKFIIEGLLQGLKDTISSVLKWFGELPGSIKDKLGDAKEWLKGKGKDAIQGLKNGWEAVKDSKIGKAASDMAEYIRGKAGDAKEWIEEKGKNAIQGLKNGWESVKESEIGQVASAIGGFVKQKAGNAKEWIKEKGENAIKGLKNGWESVKESEFLSKVAQIKDETFTKIGNIKDKVKSKGKDVIDGIHAGLTNNWSTLSTWFGNLGNKIMNAIPDLSSQMVKVGGDIIGGIKNGITGAASTIASGVKTVTDDITKSFKSNLGIHSPSKVMEEEAKFIPAGIVKGMEDDSAIIEWAENISNKITDSLGDPETWLDEQGKGIIKCLINGMVEESENLIDKATELYNNLSSLITDCINEMMGRTDQSWADIKESTQQSLEDISGTIGESWETLSSSAEESGTNIFNQIGEILDSINASTEEKVKSLKEFLLSAFEEIVKLFKQSGFEIVNVFNKQLESGSDRTKNWIENMKETFRSSIPEMRSIGIEMIQSFIDGFQSIEIPTPQLANKNTNTLSFKKEIRKPLGFDFNWYAKGGVFNRAAVIGLAEHGKEAVLPLENPKTMSMLAENIINNYNQSSSVSKDMSNAIIDGMMDMFMASQSNQQKTQSPTLEFTFKTDSETLYKAVLAGKEKYNRRYEVVADF